MSTMHAQGPWAPVASAFSDLGADYARELTSNGHPMILVALRGGRLGILLKNAGIGPFGRLLNLA